MSKPKFHVTPKEYFWCFLMNEDSTRTYKRVRVTESIPHPFFEYSMELNIGQLVGQAMLYYKDTFPVLSQTLHNIYISSCIGHEYNGVSLYQSDSNIKMTGGLILISRKSPDIYKRLNRFPDQAFYNKSQILGVLHPINQLQQCKNMFLFRSLMNEHFGVSLDGEKYHNSHSGIEFLLLKHRAAQAIGSGRIRMKSNAPPFDELIKSYGHSSVFGGIKLFSTDKENDIIDVNYDIYLNHIIDASKAGTFHKKASYVHITELLNVYRTKETFASESTFYNDPLSLTDTMYLIFHEFGHYCLGHTGISTTGRSILHSIPTEYLICNEFTNPAVQQELEADALATFMYVDMYFHTKQDLTVVGNIFNELLEQSVSDDIFYTDAYPSIYLRYLQFTLIFIYKHKDFFNSKEYRVLYKPSILSTNWYEMLETYANKMSKSTLKSLIRYTI